MKEKFAVILLLSFAMQALYALGMYEPFFAFSQLVKPELNFGASVVLTCGFLYCMDIACTRCNGDLSFVPYDCYG